MRVVVALGGNALLRRGQEPDADVQVANVRRAVDALAPLAREHDLVVTHGNGPQVGVLAVQSAHDPRLVTPYPFDVLGAQTQGMIGYWLVQALDNALPGRTVVCVLNQTRVDADDPAMDDPTKFIGEMMDGEAAARAADERGWTVRRDGPGWRRVIASPRPLSVVETPTIRSLVEDGVVVVCAGGGGVPVVEDEDGRLRGVEAVVDKDLTAAVLAEALQADALLVLTDVGHVQRDFGTEHASPVERTTPRALRSLDLPSGSMGPKVEAACGFVERTGRLAVIGHVDHAAEALLHGRGTQVVPES